MTATRRSPSTARACTASPTSCPVASAQVKSCVLLAGLATDRTTVLEAIPSRDHTERMLASAGARVDRRVTDSGGYASSVGNADELELPAVRVPGDLSSAAFLIAAGVLVPGARLVLEGVGVNWTRAGFLRILQRMGAIVVGELEEPGAFAPAEPVCDLDVSYGPIVATTVERRRGAAGHRRAAAGGAAGLPLPRARPSCGGPANCASRSRTGSPPSSTACADSGPTSRRSTDGFVVRGRGTLRGGRIDAHGDHRLALLGAVAGLASQEGVEVVGMEAAEVSYPGFADDIAALAAG